MNKKHSKLAGSLVWAILLISIGILLLLNNLGIVSWDVWSIIWGFWPILLIILGLQIIAGESIWGGLVAALISFLIVLAVVVYSIAAVNSDFNTRISESFPFWESLDFKQFIPTIIETELTVSAEDFPEVDSRAIMLDFTSGSLTFTEGEITPEHLLLSAVHPEDSGVPVLTNSLVNGELEVNFSTDESRGFPFFNSSGKREYNFTLGNPEIPTELGVEMTSGNLSLALGDQILSKLDLKATSGNLDISLGEGSIPKGGVSIDITSGNVDFVIPETVGLTVKYDMTSGSLSVNGNSLRGEGSMKSANWETAVTQLTITVDITSGNVRIIREEAEEIEVIPGQVSETEEI